MQRFVQKITVTPEHIDGLMHVNNAQAIDTDAIRLF